MQQPAKPTDKLAERQDSAVQRASQLQKAVRADEALTPLAMERMDQAAGTINSSRDALRAARG